MTEVRLSSDGENNNVRLLVRHNSGLFGAVWKGEQVRLQRTVAVKIIKPSMKNVADAVAHARRLARVSHPNVVTVYDVGRVFDDESNQEVDCVVMEWLTGQTLGELLNGDSIDLHTALRYSHEILDGIDAIHSAGIAHGDLHPGNIIVTATSVKLIDISCSNPDSFSHLSSISTATLFTGDIESARFVVFALLRHSNARLDLLASWDAGLRNAATTSNVRDVLKNATQAEQYPVRPVASARDSNRIHEVNVNGYELSVEAQTLLFRAANDPSGNIHVMKYMGGEQVTINAQILNRANDPRDLAQWKNGIRQLVGYDLIELDSSSRSVENYLVTSAGYEVADIIKRRLNETAN